MHTISKNKIIYTFGLNLLPVVFALLFSQYWAVFLIICISYLYYCIAFSALKLRPRIFSIIDLVMPCVYACILIPIMTILISLGAGAGNGWIPRLNMEWVVTWLKFSIPNFVFIFFYCSRLIALKDSDYIYRIFNNAILIIFTFPCVIYREWLCNLIFSLRPYNEFLLGVFGIQRY